MKKFIKKLIPNFILKYREKYIIKKRRKKFEKMEIKDIFKNIYINKLWCPESEKSNFKFYSGPGSHFPEFVTKYVDTISNFLISFPTKPNVVDLGCGDFEIGFKLRRFCNNYVAVDIFDELISINKEKYSKLNVDFRVLDITKNELPFGDICFVRQVLQHLSNDSINNFVKLIENKYKYLVITEHFPTTRHLIPNIDKPDGPDIRLYDNSAVVLTAPPFNLEVIKEIDICETYSSSIEGFEGSLKTKLLQLS